ncbi:MAG: hypothetical protein H7A33_07445 [Deltaproteobacteria bacterium]|nr:hypothetical protein [Deltaproteobacteria bacterium]
MKLFILGTTLMAIVMASALVGTVYFYDYHPDQMEATPSKARDQIAMGRLKKFDSNKPLLEQTELAENTQFFRHDPVALTSK